MKHLLTALLLTAGIGAAATAQAQTTVTFGPRLGLNISTFSYSGEQQTFDNPKATAGVQVGATANISFGNLAFQPSFIFTQKGAKLTGSGRFVDSGFTTNYTTQATVQPSYIELPLNMVYTAGGDHGFQVFAGPYVAFGVGGSGSYKVTLNSADPAVAPYNGDYPGSLSVEYGDQQNDNKNAGGNGNGLSAPPLIATFRRFDAGFNAGLGYRVGPIQAQLGYGLGLVNFVPKDTNGQDTGSKGYHRGFQLTANYFFGGK